MLKILGRETSINVRKVLWCADELGLAYEREDWGLPNRDPKVPEFLAFNPNAQVPVLIDDGFVLWESGAVIRYLAGEDPRLVPADRRERAIADQWLTWQATELNPPWGYAVMALLRNAPGYDDETRIKESLRRWGEKMAIFEARIAETGALAAGPRFTLADIVLGLSIHRWLAIPRDKPMFAAIQRYYEVLRERPAGAAWMADRFF